MSPASHLKNPALQDFYRIFNQDCELVSQLPKYCKKVIDYISSRSLWIPKYAREAEGDRFFYILWQAAGSADMSVV